MAGSRDRASMEEGVTLIDRRAPRSIVSAALVHSNTALVALFTLVSLIFVVQLLVYWEVKAARALPDNEHTVDPAVALQSTRSQALTHSAVDNVSDVAYCLPPPPTTAVTTAAPLHRPTPSSAAAASHRYLGVLSCWERMANAVVSFSQLLDMAAASTRAGRPMSVIAPTVMHGELGSVHRPESQPFDTYFDAAALQQSGVPLLRMEEFVARSERPQVVGPTLLLPVQRLLFIDYDDAVQASEFNRHGLSSCGNVSLQESSGVGRRRHNVTATGLLATEVLCVSPHVDLSDALDAVYAALDTSRPLTVFLFQHRKTMTQPESHVQLFDHLAPRYSRAIASHTWADRYCVVQMRAGWFIRCGSAPCRAEAPARMLECANKLVNSTLKAMRAAHIDAVLVAADIYGSVPEWFPEEDFEPAFAAVRDVFATAFGDKRVTMTTDELDERRLDPIGTSTLLDFELSKRAHTTVAMAHSAMWTSVYSAQIADARRRLGRDTIQVEC